MPLTTIPDLPEGRKYKIILRLPGSDKLQKAIPKLLLPEQCICCNAHTEETKVVIPLSENKSLKKAMYVPVCGSCKGHAFSDAGTFDLYFYGIALSLLGIISMSYKLAKSESTDDTSAIQMVLIASIVLLLGIILFAYTKKKKIDSSPENHAAGAFIQSEIPGELSIITTNKTLIRIIESHNPDTFYALVFDGPVDHAA